MTEKPAGRLLLCWIGPSGAAQENFLSPIAAAGRHPEEAKQLALALLEQLEKQNRPKKPKKPKRKARATQLNLFEPKEKP